MNIAIVTNILNPYRSSFFDECNHYCKEHGYGFKVYAMVGEKADRPWKYEQFQREYTELLPSRTVRIKGIFFHFNPKVKRIIKQFNPDAIVMAGSYLQPTVIRLSRAAKKMGYKTFFWSESHDDEQRDYDSKTLKLREFLRKSILKNMDGFWYPGYKAEKFINHYARKNAMKIKVPNSIENSFFGTPPSANEVEEKALEIAAKNGQRILFTPARLEEVKGIIPFFEVLKNIHREKYIWVIVGDGSLREEIKRKIKEYDLSVKLLGMKSPNEVKAYYYASHLFVLPSISDPNPLTCVEALWCGLPMFVSENVGNGPEVVREGENGYIFSYSDCQDATKKLLNMLEKNDDCYESARRISQTIAQTEFTQKLIAERAIEQTVSSVERG